ncbi:hypothetical protein [Catellatospora chokoriensis]|uniref:Uncharacterized protein n=1 Tax=Catellatospora chokoriensis TaxID=310353 RepID=A0A8J3K2C4_9ACTN|nr:hypothetical protein [Catellatospora chokoriensis]GIF89133.1 hypothetical protein Cch02nite_25770 [Catellatospora chokoriensis]
MTTDQEMATEQSEPAPPAVRGPSRNMVMIAGGAVGGLVAWFFYAWLGLRRNVVDAAGESIGSGIFLLLVLSVAGATYRSRR